MMTENDNFDGLLQVRLINVCCTQQPSRYGAIDEDVIDERSYCTSRYKWAILAFNYTGTGALVNFCGIIDNCLEGGCNHNA